MTTTTPRLDLPQVTLNDCFQIGQMNEEAQACLEHTLSQMRTLLQQRDLVSQWDDEAGSFRDQFLPVVDAYHSVQRALLELTGEEFGWSHDVSTWVDAQR